MKLAGIDGVIVDWYGLSDLNDYPLIHRNTQRLIESAAKFGLTVGICYEDQTITHLIEAKRLEAQNRVSHARSEIEWLRDNWFAKPFYLKWNGRPVLLSFGAENLTDVEWEQVLSSVHDAPLYLSEHRKRSAANGTFDWPQPSAGLAGVDTYYRDVAGDNKAQMLFMPAAFPRFDDIYKAAKVSAGYPVLADNQGRTFKTTLTRAMQSGAPFVQLVTWNDWGEGTNIEPSKEFGYRDLETVQQFRQKQDFRPDSTPADLRLPYRLWQLRQRHAQTLEFKTELDNIAGLLASDNIAKARSILQRFEAAFGNSNLASP